MQNTFDLTATQRQALIQQVQTRLEKFYSQPDNQSVTPDAEPQEIIDFVRQFDFKTLPTPQAALDAVMEGLEKYQVHITNPMYYGLFNPRANFASILADWITATYNPQMAAWSHAPFAAEVEKYLVEAIGRKFGYTDSIDGTFASGGAEANLTAVLCALNHAFPDFPQTGVFGMTQRPRIYCSAEAHHSVDKAAKCVGLGTDSVVHIPVTGEFEMDVNLLHQQIEADRKKGLRPLMIVGTAGTTGLGAIDDLNALSEVTTEFKLWFHVDAAYGGAVALHPEFREWITGIERSDSITFDIHKWLSVPMAASLFLTPHQEILQRTFSMANNYMPPVDNAHQIVDPYEQSIQWSRRFIGLKLYLSLLFYGWNGYAQTIEHQQDMGDLLKTKLREHGWLILNDSLLPIVCFTDPKHENDDTFPAKMYHKIVESGEAWLSVFPVDGKPTIRACITNYATQPADIEHLINLLNVLRKEVS
ncbi:MAG: aspartate aminotransferase family protein [Saprospiraceae bacterium]